MNGALLLVYKINYIWLFVVFCETHTRKIRAGSSSSLFFFGEQKRLAWNGVTWDRRISIEYVDATKNNCTQNKQTFR